MSAVTEPATMTANDDLIAGLRSGRRAAIARVLTELERFTENSAALLAHLSPLVRGVPVLGITGPPGAGKSTLVNALITHWRKAGDTVGVIAVDPSSPISKGAILGDRIRMSAALSDEGVFVRSLASHGYLGGLSPAAVRVIDGLDAAGFDRIIIETVGAGQSEVDVAEIADIKIVVSAPGLGDDIQAMKSGLLEIADILVVNKADRPGAEETLQQLAGAVSIRSGDNAGVRAIKVSATQGTGVDQLAALVDERISALMKQSAQDRRRRRARYLISHAAVDLVRRRIADACEADDLAESADAVLDGSATPLAAARALLDGKSIT